MSDASFAVSDLVDPSLDLVFARDGYATLPGFLSGDEVQSLRAAVERLVASPQGETCARPNNTLVPLRWDDPIVAAVLGDEERIVRLAHASLARDLRWISGYVSVKEPHSLPLWWHQDWWCWDHPSTYRRPASQVALLCYLSDADVHTGALRVLPGSHACSTPLHAVLPGAHRDPATADDPKHVAMRDQAGQLSIAVHAGDAVLTDYRLLHGTHANTGDRRRDCVLLTFTPSWRELPAEIRGHLISHPALPGLGEQPRDAGTAALLPTDRGPRRDLALNRDAPAQFACA